MEIPTIKRWIETRTIIRCDSQSDLQNWQRDVIYLPGDAFHMERIRLVTSIGSRSLMTRVMSSLYMDLEYCEYNLQKYRKRITIPAASMCNRDLDLNISILLRSDRLLIYTHFEKMDIAIPRVPQKHKPKELTEEELRAKRRREFKKAGARMLDVEQEKPPEEKVEEDRSGEPLVEIPDILKEFNEYDGLKVINLVITGHEIEIPTDSRGRQQLY